MDWKPSCETCRWSQAIGLKEKEDDKEEILICMRDGLLAEKPCMKYEYEPGTQ
jgi:hypothetical protein